MKVSQLRKVLDQAARLIEGAGDGPRANALKRLSEVLAKADKQQVAKLVEEIQERRASAK
jgi:hypothetical protein